MRFAAVLFISLLSPALAAQPAHELTHVVQQNGFQVTVAKTGDKEMITTANSPKSFRCLKKKADQRTTMVVPLTHRMKKSDRAKLKTVKTLKITHGDKTLIYKISAFGSYKKTGKKRAELRLTYTSCRAKK